MKKIMFSDRYNLTKAVIDGRKTMTRRMIKAPKRINGQYVNGFIVTDIATHEVTGVYARDYNGASIEDCEILPKYKIGEIVAIAQSYRDAGYGCLPYRDTDEYVYLKRDGVVIPDLSVAAAGVTNKMFTAADLMPHQIRITDTRIERLQDISDEDCLREGVRYFPDIYPYYPDLCLYYFERTDKEQGFYFNSPREAFAALIDKVSGKGTWDSNPFVVVYEFELVK